MGKSPIGSSADCNFLHRAFPLVSPKPAENRRLPPPFKFQSLSPPVRDRFTSLRFATAPDLCPSAGLLALRFVPRRRIRRTQAASSGCMKYAVTPVTLSRVPMRQSQSAVSAEKQTMRHGIWLIAQVESTLISSVQAIPLESSCRMCPIWWGLPKLKVCKSSGHPEIASQ